MSAAPILCPASSILLLPLRVFLQIELRKMGVRKVEAVAIYVALVAVVAATGTKAKCVRKCGNVDIPYPFGTSDDCRFKGQYTFFITCNTTFNPPKAFLGGGNVELTSISLLDGEIHILQYVAYDCYNGTAAVPLRNSPYLRTETFTVSRTKNMFMAMGCDTYAFLDGWLGTDWLTTGCMSFCSDYRYVENSCSGAGCCEIPIPGGLRNIQVRLTSYNKHKNISYFNNCSYAFVVVKDYNFSAKYLKGFEPKNVPMVLDWSIGNETCQLAQNKTSFLCEGNSKCIDRSDPGEAGYLCKCMDGYEGNPYLEDGCKDIDECLDHNSNRCEKICINAPGNYSCDCPKGYHLSADGISCTRHRAVLLLIVLASGLGLSALLLGIAGLFIGYRERKATKQKQKYFQQNGGMLLRQKVTGSGQELRIFSAEELKKATRNYHESRVLGRGGQGTVYKGMLPDNTPVAIKRSRIGEAGQFIKEIFLLSQIKHDNVVKILGCCLETEVPLLVYEFINNGSLIDHVHKPSHLSYIPWETRLKIAAQTAAALSHLHSASSGPIVHRDVKLANILVDENYNAKVSDFGASRLMPLNRSELTTLVQGTVGYLDPEYFHTNQLTEKSDVYSFGVVLIELLTSKKVLDFERPKDKVYIAVSFVSLMEQDRLLEILDHRLLEWDDGSVMQQVKEVAAIARVCVRVRGEERPTMQEVAYELEAVKEQGKLAFPGPRLKRDLPATGEESEYLFPDLYSVPLDGEVTGSSTDLYSINTPESFNIG